MKKRLIFIVFVFALLACTASASYVYAPDKESWQCFTALNTDQILSEGVYSATGETVIWNEMTFIVADLRRVEMYTAEMNRSNHAVQRAGEEYRHVNSRIFYSKGEQHVLGRITQSRSGGGFPRRSIV